MVSLDEVSESYQRQKASMVFGQIVRNPAASRIEDWTGLAIYIDGAATLGLGYVLVEA